MRGFGIDASVPPAVAVEVAQAAEEAGYQSFWVNGTPHEGALDILEAIAGLTSLPLGVGVFGLHNVSAETLVAEIMQRDLPQERLWPGVGSSRRPGALADVREACDLFREKLDVTVTTAAVGPKMVALAGEIADAVIFTWSLAPEVAMNRGIAQAAALEHDRPTPTIVSFIRVGLMPEANEAIEKRATAYSEIPHYRAVFDRHGIQARDTVVEGNSREEILPQILAEEQALDVSVIRAIPSEDTAAALIRLVDACAPTDST